MLLRILTAAVLIPAVVALVWWGPLPLLAAIAAVVAILALVEFFALGDRMGLRGFAKWTILCAAALFYAQYSASLVETHELTGGVSVVRDLAGGVVSVETVLLIFVFGAMAVGLFTKRPLQEVLPAISISSAGLLFIALPFSYILRLDEIEGAGRQLILFTLVLIWVGDMAAYFVGRSIGRFHMAPALSPKKTWEGAVANVVGSLLVATGYCYFTNADLVSFLLIAGVANIAGQMGDLIESAYKRGAGVKDSGALLPGHGGMLDRIDSLILASPVVWLLYQWLGKPAP
jgi:phosphatidate cytidylyltransferase